METVLKCFNGGAVYLILMVFRFAWMCMSIPDTNIKFVPLMIPLKF